MWEIASAAARGINKISVQVIVEGEISRESKSNYNKENQWDAQPASWNEGRPEIPP